MEGSNFSSDYFDWSNKLRSNWKVIQTELLNLLGEEKSTQWFAAHPHYVQSVGKGVAWRTYEFYFFGIKNPKNCNVCPKTTAVLEGIPGLVTAQFSILRPQTRINPHKGFTRMVLRNHLGLIVPPGDLCKIKVEEEEYAWKEGELITFDDSKTHEAWNDSNDIRAVLMFDVANPEFPYSAKEICQYKIEHIDDPFLLEIADKATWQKWLNQGYFDEQLENR